MNANILILGGNGKTGRRITEQLQNLQIPFIAASRSTKPSFDWNDESNWQQLLVGVHTVYITFQPDLAVPYSAQKISSFVRHAKEANVNKLVLLSGRGEPEAEACERIIMQSGLNWAILRSAWFMQNFSESFLLDGILSNAIILPFISAMEPFIDLDDLAEVAVKILTTNFYDKKIFELTGPELLSFKTATALIASAVKREIIYTELSIEDYADLLRSYHLPEADIWLFQYLFSEILDGRNQSVATDLEQLLNRKPTSFKAYVEKTANTGIWNIQ